MLLLTQNSAARDIHIHTYMYIRNYTSHASPGLAAWSGHPLAVLANAVHLGASGYGLWQHSHRLVYAVTNVLRLVTQPVQLDA